MIHEKVSGFRLPQNSARRRLHLSQVPFLIIIQEALSCRERAGGNRRLRRGTERKRKENRMKTLVIAEKPSVGRDIARVLGCRKQSDGALEGDKYIVTWGLGHLVELADPESYDPKYKEWKMEDLPMMPDPFKLEVIGQTAKQ